MVTTFQLFGALSFVATFLFGPKLVLNRSKNFAFGGGSIVIDEVLTGGLTVVDVVAVVEAVAMVAVVVVIVEGLL